MIVDANNMWLPENLFKDDALMDAFLRCVPKAYGEDVKLAPIPGTDKKQIVISKPKGYENLNFTELFADNDTRLRIMDESGIDKCVLRLPCWHEWLSVEMCRKVNDAAAKTVKAHPDRFMALAFVPPWGDKECLEELERCVQELGCVGVEFSAHYGTLYLDAEEFMPHYQKISELDIPINVHHTPLPVDYHHLYDYANLRRSYGRCTDLFTSAARVLFSGLFEKLPNLRFMYTHFAGALFSYTKMIAPQPTKDEEELQRFDPAAVKVRGYLKKNLYHDITGPLRWTKKQLELAVEELGAEQILFSNCYPVRMTGISTGVDYIKSLNISEEDKSLILAGNAIKMFKIKA